MYIIFLLFFYILPIISVIGNVFARVPLLIIEEQNIKAPLRHKQTKTDKLVAGKQIYYMPENSPEQIWKTLLLYIFPFLPHLYLLSLDKVKTISISQYESKKNSLFIHHPDATLSFVQTKKQTHRLRQFLNDHAIQGEAISDIENK
ncbi:hypothetical protein, partial [Longirhabdus pacifica]|uniref:hypothetical protein n=1 Tax=Longirhabdus pacifica TaxID=2305227 RepID=UPI0013E8B061